MEGPGKLLFVTALVGNNGARRRRSALYVIGVDEAGRGPLAGPVTAAAVVLGNACPREGLDDSKVLAECVREELYQRITAKCLAYSIISVGPRRIETSNILEAAKLAMQLAAERVYRLLRMQNRLLRRSDCFLLIDGISPIRTAMGQETIIKGDGRVAAIAAASILAKVARDNLMRRIAARYPGYDFEKHKGYATPSHRDSIRLLGPTQVHRRTFAGVREHVRSC